MAAGEIGGPARDVPQRRQQGARQYRRVCCREQLRGEGVVPGTAGGSGEQVRRLCLDEVGIPAQHLRERAESIDDARVVLPRDHRQQIQTQPIAQVAPGAVRAVGAPGYGSAAEPALDGGPPREKQRVHQAPAVAGRRDAAEPRRSGPGYKTHQHRLGLVVPGVAERNDRPPPAREAEQIIEAQLAGEFLHRGRTPLLRGEGVAETEVEAQAEAPRQRRDGGGIALRLAPAQPVVEVGEFQGDAETLPGREQQVRQAGRVGAAGDRGNDPRTRRDEPVAGDVAQEFREQRRGIRGQMYYSFVPIFYYVRNWDSVCFRWAESCPKESTICFIRITTLIVSRAAA